MPNADNAHLLPGRAPPERGDWGAAVLLSPWLWAAALTLGFYQAIDHVPVHRQFFERYFQAHWILYAEVASFFMGVAILGRKLLCLINENRALAMGYLDGHAVEPAATPLDRARAVWEAILRGPRSLARTRLVERCRHACEFLAARESSDGLDDHLRYRADAAAEALSASYAFVRTITWAIPILGFLGTVIGITMALANISIEGDRLAASLGDVTVGLGVAFDTTALALSLSLVLVFATFMVERAELHVLAAVEEFAAARLTPSLTRDASGSAPLADAQIRAADHLLKRTAELVAWQTGVWQQALEKMRAAWVETAEEQKAQFAAALAQGMNATLIEHNQQLVASREEFLAGMRTVAGELARAASGFEATLERQQARFTEQVTTISARLGGLLSELREEHRHQATALAGALAEAVRGWQADLSAATSAVHSQMQELRHQAELLRGITEQERELVRLQTALEHNLQSVRAVEAFDESIQNLNAAVHLLTTRAKGLAAAA